MNLLRIITLVVLIMQKGFFVVADDIWRLRYSTVISSENEITRISSNTSSDMNTSSQSGNFIFANGIGLGYSNLMASVDLEEISYKFKNSSLDLSYTTGSNFSFTLGSGKLIDGRGEIILNGVNYVTESVSGESIFLNLGIPFFGGEFLLGYRQVNSKFKNYQCQLSGKSVILAEPVNLVSGQINVGIGFLF